MLAITLGYPTRNGRSEPVSLYVGSDASAAKSALLNLPDGIARGELFLHPTVSKRHFRPETAAAAPVIAEIKPETPPETPSADAPPAEETIAETPPEPELIPEEKSGPSRPRSK